MTASWQLRPENTWPASLRWACAYLPDYFSSQPCAFHVELFETLEDPDQRLIARVAPRGHAKSTCAAFAYPLWCICTQRRRNIVIITHAASLATGFVRDLRQTLETNERIRAEYGDLCAAPEPETDASGKRKRRTRAKWTETLLQTATGVTVQAKGSHGSFRGTRTGPQRPDLIICDDLETDTRVESPEQRRKLESWLRRAVLPALTPDGQLIVLGSLLHHDSLLANLRNRQRYPGWNYRVFRALEAEPDPEQPHHFRTVSLWPDRWPVPRLEEERQRIGTRAFEQEYQANPIDDALRVFRAEWLEPYDPATLAHRPLVNLIAVDPATGTTAGDFFALWVGSVDPADGVIYTRALRLARVAVPEQVRMILAACKEWHPVRIGIETTAYQAALHQILEELSRNERLYLPIVPVKSTANKRARIEGSAAFFEQGTFRLPPGLDPEVEAQFLHFPKARHDDAPDVCAMGIELARGLRSLNGVGGIIVRTERPHRGEW